MKLKVKIRHLGILCFAVASIGLVLNNALLTTIYLQPTNNLNRYASLQQPGANDDVMHSFTKAVQQTTRLLYKDSPHLNKWLSAPLPTIYTYNTLHKNWSDIDTISNCIDETYGLNKNNWTGCKWKTQICDTKPSISNGYYGKYLSHKSNYNQDIAYLQWFQRYPYQTSDPSRADILLVPFPYKSKCTCNKSVGRGGNTCSFSKQELEQHVFSKLTHFETRKEHHLFITAADFGYFKDLFPKNTQPSFMSINLGPSEQCRNPTSSCGHLTTPYLSVASKDQPGRIKQLSQDWWFTRKRTYSLSAIMSAPPQHKMRVELAKNMTRYVPKTIYGMPTNVTIQKGRSVPQFDTNTLYEQSVLCPILPGDGAVQKRFFDVILCGCIPLVPVFYPSNEEHYPTFFQWRDRPSVKQTYPFHRGTFFGDDSVGIDILDLVVTFDGFCGLDCMASAAEKVMRNNTELTRLRLGLREYSTLFTYGLDENRYKFVDAFTAMIVSLRHHVMSMTQQ